MLLQRFIDDTRDALSCYPARFTTRTRIVWIDERSTKMVLPIVKWDST